MSNISQKLTYLNTTKSQLKDMINYGLDNNNKITNSTTFREYVSSIFNAFIESLRTPDTLFTNLPKKSGTGANITLNDTANAPMRIELGASEISQAGTPTPSSPQDIHTISGSNKVVVRGSNSFDSDSITSFIQNLATYSNGLITTTTLNDASTTNVMPYFPNITLPSETYYLSMDIRIKSGTGEFIKINDGSVNWEQVSGPTLSNTFQRYVYKHTYDSVKTFNQMLIQFNKSSSAVYEIKNIKLSTSSNTNYEPYVSQEAQVNLGDIEYCKIGNYEDKFIRTSGKNLFNQTIEVGTINSSGNNASSTDNSRSVDYTSVNENTTYTISSNVNCSIAIRYYNSSKTFLSSGTTDTTPNTFTTPSGTAYVRFVFVNTTDTNAKVQLELGDEATSYEPYGTNEWYIKKKPIKVVLDGSENWFKSSVTTINRFGITFSDLGITPINELSLSSHFIYKTGSSTVPGTFYLATTLGNMYIDYSAYDSMTKDDFKTWLSNNNVSMYLVLATPTYTQITGTLAEQLENVYQKMLSYTGQTNINQVNNNLSFNLSVQAIEDLN